MPFTLLSGLLVAMGIVFCLFAAAKHNQRTGWVRPQRDDLTDVLIASATARTMMAAGPQTAAAPEDFVAASTASEMPLLALHSAVGNGRPAVVVTETAVEDERVEYHTHP